MKDVALLTRLKYNAVSVKSESTVDIDFLHSLKFQNKYILFDFDITGAKLAHQITLSDPTWQIKYVERTDKLYLPSYTKSNDIKFLEQFYNLTKYKQETIKGKDISDYCFHNGLILTKKKCQIMFT